MTIQNIKLDFHLHTQEDPHDYISYDAHRLIEMMAERGYGSIAVTNHNKFTWNERLHDHARDCGVVLFRGIERTIRNSHILLINFKGDASEYRSLNDIARAKRPDNLVIAAHPYFPMPTASGALLDKHPEIFDAVEYCHYYVKNINFNNWAVMRATDLGKPLVGNSDAHTVRQIGRTYTVVQSEKNPEAIIQAIKDGNCEVETRPFKATQLIHISAKISLRNFKGRVVCLLKNGKYGYRGPGTGIE